MTLTITEPAPPLGQPHSRPRYVFVYGTLRRGEERDINLLLPSPVFIGMSHTPGTLYHLGACNYPGLRLGGVNPVQGEVYQITPELERKLDEIEFVLPVPTGEYIRREIAVQVRDPRGRVAELTCLTYEISEQRIGGTQVIASGDWAKR